MLTRNHIIVLLSLAVIIWAATLLFLHLPLSLEYLKPFFATVSALTFACVAFNRWLWSWPVFKGWLVNRPLLQGTWKAQVISNSTDPTTGTQIPIEGVMVIRQTFSTLTARLFTKESSSLSVTCNLTCQDDGAFRLFAVYQNTPDVQLRGLRSEIHYGAFMLDVLGDPANRLSGHYWTDRGTKGSLQLTDRATPLVSSYEQSQ